MKVFYLAGSRFCYWKLYYYLITSLLAVKNLVLCVSIKGAQKVRFLYNSLQFLAAEQNPVWNKTWQYIPLGEKENNSAEKEGFLYMLFFPFPFARNK